MRSIYRRDFLKGAALAAGGTLLMSPVVFARTKDEARFVFMILRGGLDGLTAVPPYGDPDYARLRRELAIAPPGNAGGALRLDSTFGLHPGLSFLHESFSAGELLVLHAVATPYRGRSHFDGQDVLENGSVRAHATQSGWLNRALATLPSEPGRSELGVALGHNVPLVMRGPAPVASWSPSRLPDLEEDTLQRIMDLYASDSLLSERLADALQAEEIAKEDSPGAERETSMTKRAGGRRAARHVEVLQAAAGFLRREDGARVAVLEAGGWDTHANQGGAQGQLAIRLAALDQGLRVLKQGLGEVWSRTVVCIATEFGRTAATNGTRGTDHGTAAASFLLGGAVRGGRVLADWPGLSMRALYEQRDLNPTLDLRSVLKGVLSEHLHVASAALESSVFPESAKVKVLTGLTRA